MKRPISIFLMVLFMAMYVFPADLLRASAQTLTEGDTPAVTWPTYIAYTNTDNNPILDPASEPGVSPIDTDITSGVDRGTGKLPSVYVASDGTNFFVRFRLKGDPRDSKGGFLSSVWEVQLASDGKQVATIGLDGKPTSEDYVYVANADGTNVHPIYVTTTPGGSTVPGTRVVHAENGQYFLDFQVPIARVTEIAPGITPDTPVKLFYGTSRAANLSVINKEYMQTTSGDGNSTDFNGGTAITLRDPAADLSPKLPTSPTVITIDSLTNGGSSTQPFASNNIVAAGTTSLKSGTVAFQLNGNDIGAAASITNGA